MFYIPQISRRSVTGITLIINVIVFILLKVLPGSIVTMGFVAIPGIISPGLLLSNISHFDLIHLLSNMYMLALLGGILESFVPQKKYILLLVLSGLFVSLGGFFLFGGPTIGFSGIAMAMVAYAYFSRNIFIAKDQLLFLLVINLLVGFSPSVSLAGHAMGAIAGFLYARWRG